MSIRNKHVRYRLTSYYSHRTHLRPNNWPNCWRLSWRKCWMAMDLLDTRHCIWSRNHPFFRLPGRDVPTNAPRQENQKACERDWQSQSQSTDRPRRRSHSLANFRSCNRSRHSTTPSLAYSCHLVDICWHRVWRHVSPLHHVPLSIPSSIWI
jgi:hypothetical protein